MEAPISPFIKMTKPVWMSSDELDHPSEQELRADEARPFLEFLFADVARKPEDMSLRKAASVSKYLDALACKEEQPGQDRQVLAYLSRVVWRTARRAAPIKLSAKDATIDFLHRHSGTYLPDRAVDRAVELIRERPVPTNPTKPARLVSRSMSIQSKSVARLQDDLSERIYAAYWALRLAKIHGARRRVAETLNAKSLKRSSRGDRTYTWDSDTVYERVKQFEDRQLGAERRTEEVRKEVRRTFARKWIDSFRYRQELAES